MSKHTAICRADRASQRECDKKLIKGNFFLLLKIINRHSPAPPESDIYAKARTEDDLPYSGMHLFSDAKIGEYAFEYVFGRNFSGHFAEKSERVFQILNDGIERVVFVGALKRMAHA